MQRLRERIQEVFEQRVQRAFPEHIGNLPAVEVQYPADTRYGEYALNIAMQLAPIVRKNPMEIAQKIASGPLPGAFAARVDVVEPGFINISLDRDWLAAFPKRVLRDGADIWQKKEKQRERIHLEYISANPTGPLTAANGRGGFTGDVLARVLTAVGKKVHKEYYVNDVGNQVDTLAESVLRRYFVMQGIPVEFTENLYQGEYIKDLAAELKLDNVRLDNKRKLRDRIKGSLVKRMMKRIAGALKRAGIVFDRFYFESELYKKGLPEKMLNKLRELNVVKDAEGATWILTSRFGDEKDRVVVKQDGEKTYFLSDIAYLWDKYKVRKFDRGLLLIGADHHGYVNRLMAAKQALGIAQAQDIILFQLVRIMAGGQEVRMSKRQGTFVTLDEVIEEVGPDAARFFFLMHTPERHMDFDLDLAKKKSKENPVYYVQYAYTRAGSVLKKVEQLSKKTSVKLKKQTGAALSERGRRLVILSLRLPEVLDDVARTYEVHRLAQFALEYAEAFHVFYDNERVLEQDMRYDPKRLEVTQMSYTILAGMLDLIGISKPQKM